MLEVFQAFVNEVKLWSNETEAHVLWDWFLEHNFQPTFNQKACLLFNDECRGFILPGRTFISRADGTNKYVPNGQDVYVWDIPLAYISDDLTGVSRVIKARYQLRQPEELTEWVFGHLDVPDGERHAAIPANSYLPPAGWSRWTPPKPEESPGLDVDSWLPDL